MEDNIASQSHSDTGTITSVICPNCSSNSVQIQNDDTFLCKSCGTIFKHVVPNNNQVFVTNEYHLSPSGLSKEVCTLKPLCDKTQFTRNALIWLASRSCTPEDVMDSNFSPVETNIRQYIEVEAKYTVSWSATIGHDRQEKYLTTDRVRDRNTGQYREQLVEKTRTVTDWLPQTGVYYDTRKNIYALSGDSSEGWRFWEFLRMNRSAVVRAEDGNIPESPVAVTSADLAAAGKIGNELAEERCQEQLPGDKHKDFHASVVSEPTSITQYVVHEYTLPYTLRGTDYSAHGYDGGDTIVETKFPNALSEIENEVAQKTKGSLALSVFFGAACVIMCIVGMFVALPNPLIWLAPTVPLFALTLGINIMHFLRKNKEEQKINTRAAERKVNTLTALLSECNLKPLTEQERQTILSNHHVK